MLTLRKLGEQQTEGVEEGVGIGDNPEKTGCQARGGGGGVCLFEGRNPLPNYHVHHFRRCLSVSFSLTHPPSKIEHVGPLIAIFHLDIAKYN